MGVFLGGNCPGEAYPGWEFSLVEVFRVGIARWEYLCGNFPGGSFHVTIKCFHSFSFLLKEFPRNCYQCFS